MIIKLNKQKIKTFIKLTLFLIFIVIGFSLINKKTVNAQPLLNIGGQQCIENFQDDCPSGSIPVREALSSFSFTGITSSKFEESLREEYGVDYNNICISQRFSNIFGAFVSRSENNNAPTLPGEKIEFSFVDPFNLDDFEVPRACPRNWELQTAPNPGQFGTNNINIYGCCPDGLTFVNRAGNEGELANKQFGVCCRIPGNAENARWDEGGNSCIYTANGDEVQVFGPETSSYTSAEQVSANASDIDYFRELAASESVNGQRPQLGRNLGETYSYDAGSTDLPTADFLNGSTEVRIVLRDIDGSESACPDIYSGGCVALDNGEIVDPDSLLTESSLTCQKCFTTGEAIRLTNDDTALELCDGNGETITQDLINNNIQDTIAYLRADEENRPLLESCREQGGIYVAIGCIDPSPIGIITGLIRISFGIMGGVALIQLILAGLAYQSGQEEQIQEAQKRVIATIGGLAILVFSVLILRVIGVNVLDIVPEGAF